jgi:hypothetical protein
MDQWTTEDWIAIRQAVGQWQSLLPERVKAMDRENAPGKYRAALAAIKSASHASHEITK